MDGVLVTVMRRDTSTAAGEELLSQPSPHELAVEDARAAPLPVAPVRSILICRPNSRLGNTVLLTPLLQEIERALPQARIDILTSFPLAAQLFSGFRGVGAVHATPAHGAHEPHKFLRHVLAAALPRYDLVIDPEPQSWTSGFLTRLMRAQRKLGFESHSKRRRGYINVPVSGAPKHMGSFPVYLFRSGILSLDAEEARQDPPVLDIRLSRQEREAGARQLAQLTGKPGPVVTIAAAATGQKQYPVAWWRELAAAVKHSCGAQIIEIGPPTGERSFAELPGYSSRNLREVASLIAASGCFVCADSGLMHLGAASLCPTLGLFKVTKPEVYEPYGPGNAAIIVKDGDGVQEVAAHATATLARPIGSRRGP